MGNVSSIKFKNYKCFKDEASIEDIKTVNLLIGKNNCGKSSVLDVIEKVLSRTQKLNDGFENTSIKCEMEVDKSTYAAAFSSRDLVEPFYGYFNENNTFYAKGKAVLEKKFYFPLQNCEDFCDERFTDLQKQNPRVFLDSNWRDISNKLINGISRREIFKISAERDIKKEDKLEKHDIDSNGNGITRFIEYNLLNVDGIENLIRKDVLEALNLILKGEDYFTNIQVLNNKSNKIEIFLYENGIRIPLSKMGSGLKTILFVLIFLFDRKNRLSSTIFLFEELENNLHPEIQKRLFKFIYDFVHEKDAIVFITSHSPVAINCFYGKNDASIYHVFKSEKSSAIEKVEDNGNVNDVFGDLGFFASDIFQSNGIIWVEGPSDRLYIKKWLSIKYPELFENEHFTFLYYGGKNLSHFTADKELEDGLINVLLTNRNAIIVMDHDEDSEEQDIRKTKQRIKKEFENKNMYVWITEGKEIENYILVSDIKTAYNDFGEKAKIKEQVEAFEKFSDYIKPLVNNFSSQKVSFAHKINFTNDSLKVMDLEKKIDTIAGIIKKWNNI